MFAYGRVAVLDRGDGEVFGISWVVQNVLLPYLAWLDPVVQPWP